MQLYKNGLQLIPTSNMSREEWLMRRQEGIGGSDISSILGLNSRFSALELFYQKIGFSQSSTEENEAMFWGSRVEDPILSVGQYYDFDTSQYIDNYNCHNKLRKITKLRYMVNNPKYPWLLANLDGAVNFTPRNFKMDCPAESKAISRKSAEMWADGIPPYHLVQITTYCIVCEPMMYKKYACLFYLEDGSKFRGYYIPVLDSIIDQILTRSEEFWNKVLKGREIMATVKDDDTRLKFLADIEPSPDSSTSYYEFLSDLFKKKQNFIKIEGNENDWQNAIQYKALSDEINSLEDSRQQNKNQILKSLHNASANIIEFPGKGKITWNKKLYVNITNKLRNAA
jgi:putative phage-type endonuclease